MTGGIITRFARMKKKIIIIYSIMLVLQFLSANSTKAVTQGNTSSNITLGGGFAQDGEWIYTAYNWFINQDGLCKFKKGQCIRLTSEWGYVANINVMGDYVIYTVGNLWHGKLKKYSIKTGLSEVLDDGNVVNVVVTDKHIFYVLVERDYYIQRMDLSGKNKVTIQKYSSWESGSPNFAVYADKIFSVHESQDDKVYRTDINGKNKVKVSDMKAVEMYHPGFYFSNGWIYIMEYKNYDYSKIDQLSQYLYRMRSDGSQTTKLFSKPVISINVSDKWLYIEFEKTRGLYRSDLDGKKLKKIGGREWDHWPIFITNDYIINEKYIMRIDGKSKIMTLKEFAGIKD